MPIIKEKNSLWKLNKEIMQEENQKKSTIFLAGVEREDDERCFARYEGDAPCELKIDQKTYRGRVFDFSDGVGAVMENEGISEFEIGTQTYMRIPGLDVEFSAEIAWITDADGQLKVGFRRIENFKGNLKHYRLPDVLTGISRSKKTGVLEITSGSTIKRIIVQNGDKIFAASNNEDDRLGEYLLKKGTITIEEFEQASYLIAKNGDRLGKVLIDLAYLTPSELFQAVQDQIEEIILSLFSLEDGTFEFKEGPLPTNEVITLKTSSANLIFKGIKKIENFVQVKKMCPSPETVMNISQIPVDIFKSLTLDHDDKKILSYVNGVHPLKTILSLSPSSNYETLKTISALLSIGFIHVKDEDEEPAKLSIEKIFSEPGDEIPEEFRVDNSEAEPVMEEVKDTETGPVQEAESLELIERDGSEAVVAEVDGTGSDGHMVSGSPDTDREESVQTEDLLVEDSEEEDAGEDTHLMKSPMEETISEGSEVIEETGDSDTVSLEPLEIMEEEAAAVEDSEVFEETGDSETVSPEPSEAMEEDMDGILSLESTGKEEECPVQIDQAALEVQDESLDTDKTGLEGSTDDEAADCSGCSDCSCSTGSHDEEKVVINTADIEEESDLIAESAVLPNEINGAQEWSKEENEINAVDLADISEAEAVMEESIVEKELEKPEPRGEFPEMAFAADGGAVIMHEGVETGMEDVPACDMDDAFGGTDQYLSTFSETQAAIDQEEGAFLEDKEEVDEKPEDIEPETVPRIVENDSASETGLSRKNRFYISIAFLIIVITGAGLSLVYDDMKSVVSSPVEHEISGTIEEEPAVPMPSTGDKILDGESLKESESGTPFPSFREEILGKILSE